MSHDQQPARRPRGRRWFQFGLSHLLLVPLLAAAVLGWQRQRISHFVDGLWAKPTEDKTHRADMLARELWTRLKQEFPRSTLTIHATTNKVVVDGVVDDPVHVEQIVDVAKDYYAEVINRVTVCDPGTNASHRVTP